MQKGTGTFPVDAPINDATVRLHYSVYRPDAPDAELCSTYAAGAGADAGKPLEFTTGEGVLPHGVEMAIKLMLPGERCTVTVAPEHGFRTCGDPDAAAAEAGAPLDETLTFALWLVSFTPEGHPQVMDAAQVRAPDCAAMRAMGATTAHDTCWSALQVIAYASKQKEHANALYRGQRVAFAIKKYDHAVNAVKRFRGESTDEQNVALTALQASLLSNLAAAYMAQSVRRPLRVCSGKTACRENEAWHRLPGGGGRGHMLLLHGGVPSRLALWLQEYSQAIKCCDAAFALDPTNLKLVLRRGKASSLNGDFDDAQEAVAALQEASGAPEELLAGVAELAAANERRRAQAKRAQKKQFGNLFER